MSSLPNSSTVFSTASLQNSELATSPESRMQRSRYQGERCCSRSGVDASQPRRQISGQDRKFGSDTPMKRPAQPEEIAPAFVFLAAPSCSSYITGEVLPIIGGYSGG